MRSSMFSFLTLAGGVALVACSVPSMPEPREGAELFSENCAVCHGADGAGQGALAWALETRPADLTLIRDRRDGQFSRTEVLSVIDGYQRLEVAGQEMPEFGLLLEGPSVPVDLGDGTFSPVPRPLAAILVYLEEVQV